MPLWFAFNYWYYDLWIQQNLKKICPKLCCDLLSITGITIFEYNVLFTITILFQLWFAFNYWYYDLWIQPIFTWNQRRSSCDLLSITGITIFEYNTYRLCLPAHYGCDLLSITGITIFEYNMTQIAQQPGQVVICFQLLVLRSLNTTVLTMIQCW